MELFPVLPPGKLLDELSRVGGTRVRQRDVARVTKRGGCEGVRRGEGWKTGRIWWPGWPRGEEGRESPGQDFSTPPRRSRTRTRFSCVRSFFERGREKRSAFLNDDFFFSATLLEFEKDDLTFFFGDRFILLEFGNRGEFRKLLFDFDIAWKEGRKEG